ncbi:hypothetical protein K2Z84_08650, partial [Candidatus Binatia bacterium]|nr:hypothetical protein [Candidatus Binatia bacterium]
TARELGLGELRRTLDDAEHGTTTARTELESVPKASMPTAVGTATLRREGDVWSIAHGDESVRLRDMKGLHYLVTLLREPGRELHALDVVGADATAEVAGARALDADARGVDRERLAELRDELAEAEEHNDVGRAEMLRNEIEEIADELARVIGAGPPRAAQRRAGSLAERARLNATRALRKVIDRIQGDCPRLGHHLSNSIVTGRICTYREDPTYPVTWRIDEGAPSEK